MLQSIGKIALVTGFSVGMVSGSAHGQSVSGQNGGQVVAGNSNSAQTYTPGNAANSGTSTPQAKPTAAQSQQFQQQMQAEMARTAKDMITHFDLNGDKALNEAELQEALTALSTWMRNNENRGASAVNSTQQARGQTNNNRSATNSANTNAASNNSVPASDQPANSNATSQRIRRRR
jgi:hypothetical protein